MTFILKEAQFQGERDQASISSLEKKSLVGLFTARPLQELLISHTFTLCFTDFELQKEVESANRRTGVAEVPQIKRETLARRGRQRCRDWPLDEGTQT